MFNNVALDVFIGLVFIFLLYSLLASIIQEMIATRLAFRAKVLEKAIIRMMESMQTDNHRPFGDRIDGFLHLLGLKNLLKKGNVAPWFYAHPLIKYLAEDNYYSKPAYISASNFSKVIIDLLKDFNLPESQAVQSIHNSIMNGFIHKLPIDMVNIKSDKLNPAIKILLDQNAIAAGADRKKDAPSPQKLATETVELNHNTALFLKSLWQDSGADLDKFRSKLEDWFNDTMARASGWYKKYTRVVLLIIGLIIAYAFNVDSIAIRRILTTNKPARDQLVQMAIADKDNLNPDKFKNNNDSILKATYIMVSKEADNANDVLGLGKPWKDTCKMCNDSLNSKEFTARFDSVSKIKNGVSGNVALLSEKLLDENNALDSLTGISLPGNAGKIKSLQRKIASDSSLLLKYQSANFPEYDRMQKLQERCQFIKKARAGKIFVYSPNQHGGLETILGWLITAMALTLGAPFWFDLLKKLVNLRGAGGITNTGGDNTTSAKNPPGNQPPPINVTVNPNPDEEAVG
jgi:hypothetical protein